MVDQCKVQSDEDFQVCWAEIWTDELARLPQWAGAKIIWDKQQVVIASKDAELDYWIEKCADLIAKNMEIEL